MIPMKLAVSSTLSLYIESSQRYIRDTLNTTIGSDSMKASIGIMYKEGSISVIVFSHDENTT